MDDDDRTVSISSNHWRFYGCRIIGWIDRSISEDCYRLRFGRTGDDIRIVFSDPSQAVFFRLVVGQVMGDTDRLLQTIE